MARMDLQSIVRELRSEVERLEKAIAALERDQDGTTAKLRGRKRGSRMSAVTRRRIGLAVKKRWAERKGKG